MPSLLRNSFDSVSAAVVIGRDIEMVNYLQIYFAHKPKAFCPLSFILYSWSLFPMLSVVILFYFILFYFQCLRFIDIFCCQALK